MNGRDGEAIPDLVVDLDGTLLRSDILWEQLALLGRTRIFDLLVVPFWMLGGKANFKAKMSARVSLDYTRLPYRREVLDLVVSERSRGRRTVLASASQDSVVKGVSSHLGLFDMSVGTKETNIKGLAKLDRLKELGVKEFHYVGDSSADVPIWTDTESCKHSILVNPSRSIVEKLESMGAPFSTVRDSGVGRIQALLSAMRLHQAIKNLLIFAPMVLSHQFNIQTGLYSLLAFLLFSMTASGIYLFNDFIDLDSDRIHPQKSDRPFASGRLPLSWMIASPILVLGAVLSSLLFSPPFALALAGYAIINGFYTFFGKKTIALDVVILAGLYPLRILAGGLATGITMSTWLVVFSVFFFLGIAFSKRYAEIRALATGGAARGRAYHSADGPALLALGVASSFVSVLVLLLYVRDIGGSSLYRHPAVLWLSAPVLIYMKSFLWIAAGRGQLNEDPVLFLLKTREMLVSLCVLVLMFVVAL